MAEDYESHQDRSQYTWELPYNSCMEFWRQPAYSILRDKDQPSLNLEVRFPRAIISYAKSKEDREMPWEYRWHNNLTGYNPNRLDQKIRRKSLRRHGVELISWRKYFSKEKADVKFRKELHKNSERSARKEALKLEKEIIPDARTSSAGPSAGGNPNAKRKGNNQTPGARTSTTGPSAGGNPNAKRKSEQEKGASKAKGKVKPANSSRSLREYLVDSGAALHIISQQRFNKRRIALKAQT